MFITIKKNDSLDDKVDNSYILIKTEDIISVEDPFDWEDSDGECYTILKIKQMNDIVSIPIAESAKEVYATILKGMNS